MFLQNTDSRNIQRKQQQEKNATKVFSWLKDNQNSERRSISGASNEIWKYWVDFKNLAVMDGNIYWKKTETSDTVVLQQAVSESPIPHNFHSCTFIRVRASWELIKPITEHKNNFLARHEQGRERMG